MNFTKTIYIESGVVQNDRLLTPEGKTFHIPSLERPNFPHKSQREAVCFHYVTPVEGRDGYIFPGAVTELRGAQSSQLKQNHEHTIIEHQPRDSRSDSDTENVAPTPAENSILPLDEPDQF